MSINFVLKLTRRFVRREPYMQQTWCDRELTQAHPAHPLVVDVLASVRGREQEKAPQTPSGLGLHLRSSFSASSHKR